MSAAHLIHALGLAGIFAIIFAETGLLAGFFLPGDTMLISAGLLAARGQLNLPLLLIGASVSAVAGDAVGYRIGRLLGDRLYQRDDSFWFRREHLHKAQRFYEKHGGKTIFLARFLIGVRTFAPVVAGAARMPYRRFALFNIAGAVAWIWGIILPAYWFGASFGEFFDHYVFIGSIIVLPFPLVFAAFQYFRLRRARARFRSERGAASSGAIERPE